MSIASLKKISWKTFHILIYFKLQIYLRLVISRSTATSRRLWERIGTKPILIESGVISGLVGNTSDSWTVQFSKSEEFLLSSLQLLFDAISALCVSTAEVIQMWLVNLGHVLVQASCFYLFCRWLWYCCKKSKTQPFQNRLPKPGK